MGGNGNGIDFEMVYGRRVFNQLTDVSKYLQRWEGVVAAGWEQFDRLHKSAICAIMRQVPFDYNTMTRGIRTHTHTRARTHTFLLPVSHCRRGHVRRGGTGEEGRGKAHSLSVRVKAISLNLQLLCRLLNNSLCQACYRCSPPPHSATLRLSLSPTLSCLLAATFVRHRLLFLPSIRAKP